MSGDDEVSKRLGTANPARGVDDPVIVPVPWRFHAGMQALVFCDVAFRGKAVAFPTAGLRAAGWKADDLELRKSLPRAEERRIQVSNEAQAKALAASHAMTRKMR